MINISPKDLEIVNIIIDIRINHGNFNSYDLIKLGILQKNGGLTDKARSILNKYKDYIDSKTENNEK